MKHTRFIQEKLNELFPNPPIPLNHKDHFTLLIAVVLSAQCTDARVNLVTPALFEKADTPAKMKDLPLLTIENLIKTCGLYKTKAKALKNLSKDLIDNFQGNVPNTLEELITLPGVGRKTASVVLTQCFNMPAFPVDTHIHRLAKRWKLSTGKNVLTTEKDLKAIFPKKDWIKLHLQIIYFARQYCPAKKHNKALCPICSKVTD